MNIYLYGIGGVYNYGCEAMVRGISERFHEIFPESNIIYKSRRVAEDSRALESCKTARIEPLIYQKRHLHQRAFRYMIRKLSIAQPQDYISVDWSWTQNCDILVVIGGDVFDLLPTQKTARKYNNERIHICRLVKKAGGKVILWGISIGDFEANPYAKKTLMDYFNDTVDIAIIRDKNSYDYLRANGVNNIALVSDPAYMMRNVQTEVSDQNKKILGINLSPLANRYLEVKRTEEEWIAIWSRVVAEVYSSCHYDEVYLIPHVVIADNPSDDDFQYLYKIAVALKRLDVPVTLLPENLGFLGIKRFLAECDLVMAARMHCAVNAVTCGVPTVFLSYSPKSFGMCEHVYGNMDYCLDMNEMAKEVDLARIQSIVSQADDMRVFLKTRNLQLRSDAAHAINIVKDYL